MAPTAGERSPARRAGRSGQLHHFEAPPKVAGASYHIEFDDSTLRATCRARRVPHTMRSARIFNRPPRPRQPQAMRPACAASCGLTLRLKKP